MTSMTIRASGLCRLGEPEHDVIMVGPRHRRETDRTSAGHGRGHVGFALPLELVGFVRGVGDDEGDGTLRQVRQRRQRGDIGGAELQPFVRVAEPHRLEIIEAAQQGCARDEIVGHAEIRFPAAGEHHRRKMSAGRAAAHMNSRGIAAEFSRMPVHPSDRSTALAHDFGERDVRGERVVHRHHAGSGPGEAFGHEAGIGAVEQAPIAAVKEDEDRRRRARRRGKDIEPLRFARAIGDGSRHGSRSRIRALSDAYLARIGMMSGTVARALSWRSSSA